MSSSVPTTLTQEQTYNTNALTLDEAIYSILGQGLKYKEWPAALEKHGHSWRAGLEKIIIKKEWEFFREEIRNMRQQGNISNCARVQSDSLNSILKRLKGKPVAGLPGCKEERRKQGRLISKDAKPRTLANYVEIWDREDRSKTASPSVGVQKYQLPIQSSSTSAIGGPQIDPSTAGGTQRTTIRENIMGLRAGSVSGSQFGSEMATYTSPPNQDESMHYPLSYGNPSASSSQGWSYNHINPLLLGLRDGIQDSDIETYQNLQFAMNSTSPRQTESHMDITARAPSQVNDNITNPRAGFIGHSVEVNPLDASPTEYTTEMNAASENYEELQKTWEEFIIQTPALPSCEGTFYDPRQTVVMEDPPFQEETSAYNATEFQDSIEASSKPDSLTPTRMDRKRRRRARRGTSGSSGYSIIAAQHFPGNAAPREDCLMIDPVSSELTSNPAFSRINTSGSEVENSRFNSSLAVKLADKLEKERRGHQQTRETLESLHKEHQAAEARILELQEQVSKLQVLCKRNGQYHERLVHDLISGTIIQQADVKGQRPSSQKPGTNLLLKSAEDEKEPYAKQPRTTFSPSKNPRPLSLVQGTGTTGTTTTSTPSRSPTSPQNSVIPRLNLPIAIGTGLSIRCGSSASSRSSNTQTNSPVVSSHDAAALSPTNGTSQSRPGSPHSTDTHNGNAIAKNDPNMFRQLRHKISNGFLKCHNEKKGGTAPPVPTLPVSTVSLPLHKQAARVIVHGEKRLTDDSGYGSLNLQGLP